MKKLALGFLAVLGILALSPAALGTVNSTTNRASYIGNGSVDTYDYPFRIFSNTDLLVTVRDDQTPSTETTLALTTDYTVTGVGVTSGGTIVLVNNGQDWLDGDGDLKSGYTLVIRRVRPLLQTTSIKNQGPYYPLLHENAFDHFIMVAQQLQYQMDYAIKKRETDDPGDVYIPVTSDRASSIFGWGASGEAIAVDYEDVVTTGGGLLAGNNLSDLGDLSTALGNLEADQPHWNAGKLQGEGVSASSPAGGQLLVYNSGSNQWEPADAGPATGGYTAPVSTSVGDNQSTPSDVTGMTADGSQFSSVEFLFEIDRKTDSEHVKSVGRLSLRYKNSTWQISRSISDGDDDGVTFSVAQVGADAQVQYTSSDMTGNNYAGTIKFGRFSFNQ